MRSYVARLFKLVRDGETEWAELLCGAIAAVWGLWVLLPMRTFDSPEYSGLRFVPEPVWGALYLAVGAVTWWAVLAEHRRVRFEVSRIIAGLFFFLGATYARSSAAIPWIVVCPIVAVFASMVHIRLWSRAHNRAIA